MFFFNKCLKLDFYLKTVIGLRFLEVGNGLMSDFKQEYIFQQKR